jgi:hypothetical protein
LVNQKPAEGETVDNSQSLKLFDEFEGQSLLWQSQGTGKEWVPIKGIVLGVSAKLRECTVLLFESMESKEYEKNTHSIEFEELKVSKVLASRTAEELLEHENKFVRMAAKDFVLKGLLKKGFIRICWKAFDIDAGQVCIIVERRGKHEGVGAFKVLQLDTRASYWTSDHPLRYSLSNFDIKTASIISVEEMLTASNPDVRKLAINPNTFALDKLVENTEAFKLDIGTRIRQALVSIQELSYPTKQPAAVKIPFSSFKKAEKQELLKLFQKHLGKEYFQLLENSLSEFETRSKNLLTEIQQFRDTKMANAKSAFNKGLSS